MSEGAAREELADPSASLSGYQRKLLVFLSVASFFEGYDFFALTQILPNLRRDLGVGVAGETALVAVINFGTVLAYALSRKADRWGRRRVLTTTIAGYTLFTFLSGLAPNVYVFALLQMLARIFLIAEWVTSMVVAAEEYPAARRGTIVGVVSAAAGFGSVVCAGVVPILLRTHYGWRSVYFVGVLPLILLAVARRGLHETRRFERAEHGEGSLDGSLWAIWSSPFRTRLLLLAAIWFLTYVCTQNAVTFWKDFAQVERRLSDDDVGRAVRYAALISMPLAFAAGKLLDLIGRKLGALVIYAALVGGVFFAYFCRAQWALTLALVFGVVGINTVLTVLNAFTTELFPTHLRGAAFAWSNNLLGRIGYVVSPLIIGQLVPAFGWGRTLRATTAFPLLALVLLLVFLPETRARELEDTARV